MLENWFSLLSVFNVFYIRYGTFAVQNNIREWPDSAINNLPTRQAEAYHTAHPRLTEYLHMTYFHALRGLSSVCCPTSEHRLPWTVVSVVVRDFYSFSVRPRVGAFCRDRVPADLLSGPAYYTSGRVYPLANTVTSGRQ